jgi:hypothetical protein
MTFTLLQLCLACGVSVCLARPLYRKYASTAPVHLLLALRQAIDMLDEQE